MRLVLEQRPWCVYIIIWRDGATQAYANQDHKCMRACSLDKASPSTPCMHPRDDSDSLLFLSASFSSCVKLPHRKHQSCDDDCHYVHYTRGIYRTGMSAWFGRRVLPWCHCECTQSGTVQHVKEDGGQGPALVQARACLQTGDRNKMYGVRASHFPFTPTHDTRGVDLPYSHTMDTRTT